VTRRTTTARRQRAPRQGRLEQAFFEIRCVIARQDAMLERVLVCLLAEGHLLIAGVPGLTKTVKIKTTAGALGGM
jgi:MoxR-like ATPase